MKIHELTNGFNCLHLGFGTVVTGEKGSDTKHNKGLHSFNRSIKSTKRPSHLQSLRSTHLQQRLYFTNKESFGPIDGMIQVKSKRSLLGFETCMIPEIYCPNFS